MNAVELIFNLHISFQLHIFLFNIYNIETRITIINVFLWVILKLKLDF